MDNEQVYGKKIFEYPLAQAIEDGRAPDHRIVVPTLTDDDLRRRITPPPPPPPPPTPTVRARDRTRPCAPPPRTWPCCAPSPATA
ncbi:hypothetical protein [Streptomyces sp. CBMAI 2042]|uniref:hypothetical protein n=1 Tax=Streptomyces sp. CBMAI 2042 TaxID=2305222 RepID=UPI001F38D404|nr:hypothetical protein [Streptomyces sp. CBMAI 2042]